LAGRIALVLLCSLLGLAGLALFELGRAQIEREVYRERLAELGADFGALRERYNDLVRRRAVTELVVEQGQLSLVVRDAKGQLRELTTPFDPRDEIYVDFVVLDGRLWIRRVFDSRTPPIEGVVVDPALVDVDWDAPGAVHGKAAYRRLGEGRWIVTVTGDGSLGLARRSEGALAELSPAPRVESFPPLEAELERATRELGVGEAVRAGLRRAGWLE